MIANLAFQTGGQMGLIAAAAFFLIAAAVAFIAFKMLKRTLKMAFRIVIVVVILGIATAGSIALWALSGSSATPSSRPARNR